MICEKCKTEFFEGRNCPNCNALAIYVTEDEYNERKQEWEAENAPEEDDTERKFKIHIDPIIARKVVTVMAVVCVIATAIFWIAGLIIESVEQSKYSLVYDNGTIINADLGKFKVYSVEKAIYTTDGKFVYENKFDLTQTEGEIVSGYVSRDGENAVFVSLINSDIVKYNLYLVIDDEMSLIRSGSNEFKIIEVCIDGTVFFEEAEIGSYEIVLNTVLYQYGDGKLTRIADNVQGYTLSDREKEFIYYDTEYQAYLYKDGNATVVDDNLYGCDVVITDKENVYYINQKGELLKLGKEDIIDTGITAKSIMKVANSEKIAYIKEGVLYCYGGSYRKPVSLITEYELYGEKINILEKSGKIYFAYKQSLYSCSLGGKVNKIKDGIESIYFIYE